MLIPSPGGKSNRRERGLENERCITGTWLGHASALVQFPLASAKDTTEDDQSSIYLLFDPIFSNRAGPTQYTGPARFSKTPCEVGDLPDCDAVFISHNHYDHLDAASIQTLLRRFPKTKVFVPLGNKTWVLSMGVEERNVYELDWWGRREFSPLDFERTVEDISGEEVVVRITCTPAQHNSGRGALDKDTTLWCGWVIEQFINSKREASIPESKRIGSVYHAGDTGYRRTASSDVVCPAFKEIGAKFGGFDLSFVCITSSFYTSSFE